MILATVSRTLRSTSSPKKAISTRVDDIVEAANTSKGDVYFHCPSKQDIVLGLIDEFANLLEQRISQSIEHQNNGIQRVDAALRARIDTFQHYRKFAKIFLVQAVGLGLIYEEKQQLNPIWNMLYQLCVAFCCAVLGFQKIA